MVKPVQRPYFYVQDLKKKYAVSVAYLHIIFITEKVYDCDLLIFNVFYFYICHVLKK